MPPDPRAPSTGKVGTIVLEEGQTNPFPFTHTPIRQRNADKPLTRRKRCRRVTWVPSDEMDFLQFRCDKFTHGVSEPHSETGIVKTTSSHGGLIVNYTFSWTESEAPLTIRGTDARIRKQRPDHSDEANTGPG